MNYQSKLITLRQIVERKYFFRVPIYQRLYVWGNDQVETLLADLFSAYNERKEIYYLGGIIAVESEHTDDSRIFDLIDGQQRFTTLWLMAHAWQSKLTPFLQGQDITGQQRIQFPIREQVREFLSHDGLHSSERVPPTLQPIVDARAIIQSYLNGEHANVDVDGFTHFIFENVQLVLTQVPTQADLNQLFAVINNRGVQLQHHEILKSKMLGKLDDSAERARYACLWDAASFMGDYIERTLKQTAKLDLPSLLPDRFHTSDGVELYIDAETVLAALEQQQTQEQGIQALGLGDILAGKSFAENAAQETKSDDADDSDEVRSIVSFPVLLQHTLRIWLHQHGRTDLDKILDKELLNIFETHFLKPETGAEEVKSFIRLLWEIRFLFDAHVIKWVSMGEEEWHIISRLRQSDQDKNRLYRNKRGNRDDQGFALLQSMLYHSQQITTHYWLTPLLAYLHSCPQKPTRHYYAYLRHLDNHLLCSSNQRPLIERSREFIADPWRTEALDASILTEASGTEFPHYWFYKLEYILWRDRSLATEEQRSSFRITAKNSIEHISPQYPQVIDRNTVSPDVLNTFGNLALVSRSINSEYGNKPFNEKRQHFHNRNTKRVDSLKMLDIYRNEVWNDEQAKAHQERMIQQISSYLQENHRLEADSSTAE